MNLEPVNPRDLDHRRRAIDTLKQRFAEFTKSALEIRDPQYRLEGAKVTATPLTLTVEYEWFELTVYFVTSLEANVWKGNAVAVLTKHPLDDERPILGAVSFDRDGLSNCAVVPKGEIANVAYYAPEMVLIFIEKALSHSVEGMPKRAGILG